MIVANLSGSLDWVIPSDMTYPIHVINFEFFYQQILGAADSSK